MAVRKPIQAAHEGFTCSTWSTCLCRYLADDFAVRTTRPTYHLFILPVASLIERLARREQNRHDASVLFLLWIFVNFQVQLSSNYRSAILIHVGVPFIEASNSNPLSFVSPSLGNSPSNSATPFSKGWKITAWMLRTDRWTDDRFISRSSDRFICDVHSPWTRVISVATIEATMLPRYSNRNELCVARRSSFIRYIACEKQKARGVYVIKTLG